MGDKKSKALKKKLKAEKKIAEAKLKVEKQKAKYGIPKSTKEKWYKNPDWVRAIASIIAIILTVIGFLYFR